MAEIYTDDLLGGYESLRADRDWSVDMMADNIETSDPALAAVYRERYASSQPAERKAAPKGRRSKADAESDEG
jgi:hypothetical protein